MTGKRPMTKLETTLPKTDDSYYLKRPMTDSQTTMPKTGGSNDWEETNDKIKDNNAKNR